MGIQQDWDQCLYCGRPVKLVGEGADGSRHTLAGGWAGTVHDVPARCGKWFVPAERRLIPTSELQRNRLVYRPDADWRMVEAVGALGPTSLRALPSASDFDYAVITEGDDATLCSAEDLWMRARPGKARDFLPLTIRSFADVHGAFSNLRPRPRGGGRGWPGRCR